MLQNMDKMNLKVQENIEGIKIVKAFVQSEQEKTNSFITQMKFMINH